MSGEDSELKVMRRELWVESNERYLLLFLNTLAVSIMPDEIVDALLFACLNFSSLHSRRVLVHYASNKSLDAIQACMGDLTRYVDSLEAVQSQMEG